MITFRNSTSLIRWFAGLACVVGVSACQSDVMAPNTPSLKDRVPASTDIAILLDQADEIEVSVVQRAPGTNYTAVAKASGTIPAGEYAGDHFTVRITGEYSAPGLATLITGSATVKIQGEQFNSIVDPALASFCCGEGYLQNLGTHWEFTVFGRVVHDGHQHLFAGLGSTLGTMNMNVADQTGTVVDPAVPPHDPGIGLLENIPASNVKVKEP